MPLKAAQPLVSIIIPCYNCSRWVGKAINSCLNQTYPNIEIVVVGSTDGSLAVLRRFLPLIRLETGPNRGGNNARNRAFELSTGEYIQYLDADDYLEPEKIARQVQFLEETKADVVYGDLRYKRHLPNSSLSYLDRIEVSGVQQDILASLLSSGDDDKRGQSALQYGRATRRGYYVSQMLAAAFASSRARRNIAILTRDLIRAARWAPVFHTAHIARQSPPPCR